MPSDGEDERVLVLNPVSGSEDHADGVIELAADRGFDVRTTAEAGDAKRLAREAAPEADLVGAVGGDGTVNEVVNGVRAADELETTTVAVVPAGTGNNFAANVGIEGVEHGFRVIEDGRRRRIDLGIANDRAFVNSCIGGVTAEASGRTASDRKREYGVLAYVMNTLETVTSFESPRLRVMTVESNGEVNSAWEGKALFVLVGNCRRFSGSRTAQANVEDGRFEVTIVEDASAIDLLREAALDRLFDQEGEAIVRRRTPALTVDSFREAVEYSLDGEMLEAETLTLETVPNALEIAVGADYRPDPDDRALFRAADR
ncbi:diacylglycerol/lipid kinase family protein [Halosolutus gelatinilyticus]|uniref:diacylglycerol/lipid kinase family protein n=1 Tax=Halosolutus gelatinilyticus TaxID=2931975 RepID=UPI001FF4BE3C|nr:YegS/Rv2252/BmrU family lipid kinase [Halosolutus gelatinilyticus]